MNGSPHGRFVWYQLMTGDATGAAAFYAEVLGWRAMEAGMGDAGTAQPTMILSMAGQPVAEALGRPARLLEQGVPAYWVGCVAVPDVDGWMGRVAEAGGSVHHGPAEIDGVGRFAVVADPQGAVFALVQPVGQPLPPPAPQTPGHGAWHELHAADGRTAFDFYAALFGWTKAEAFDTGPGGTYQMFALQREAIGGIVTRHDSAKPSWLFYFRVAGAAAAAQRVRAAGGQVLDVPHQVPGGTWVAHCRDAQGAAFALASEAR